MPHPSVRAEAQAHRASGESSVPNLMPEIFASKDDHSGTQEDRRRRAAATAPPAATVPALGGVVPPATAPENTEPPAAQTPPADLRFHKWGPGYVTVAKPHLFGEDPVVLPAYSDSVVAGYAKAKALATRDNRRVSLIVVGGGGPFVEDLDLDSNLVDIFGLGNPTIEGNTTLQPYVSTFLCEGINWHTTNEKPALFGISPHTLLPLLRLDRGIRFARCSFYGSTKAFHFQRRVVMDDCTYWFETLPDGTFVNPTLETAPCIIEMEEPQTWWSILRNCKFYYGLRQGAPESSYIPVKAEGYALVVRSGLDGGPPLPNLISTDGTFRTDTDSNAGTGAIQSGVLLDHCEVYGSARVRDWTLAHQNCLLYGGIPFESQPGGVYAYISGHDWSDASGFTGRQFGIVLFDGCNVHANEAISIGVADPFMLDPLFTGGVAVFFRNSQHMARFDALAGGSANFANGPTTMLVNTVMSSTPRHLWGSGTGLIPSDVGSHTDVTLNWHPLFA
jgi:hypothetical protein